MRNFADIVKRHPGAYNPHVVSVVKDDLKELLESAKDECTVAEGVVLVRAQGAVAILRQLVEVMEKGVAAPAAVAGISVAN